MSVCKMESNKTEHFNILKVLARIATVGGKAFLILSRHVFTSVCSRSSWKFDMDFLLIPRNSILLIKVFASCPIWNCGCSPSKQVWAFNHIHATGTILLYLQLRCFHFDVRYFHLFFNHRFWNRFLLWALSFSFCVGLWGLRICYNTSHSNK